MIRLVALELENFQSIVEPTRIEFAPITMLCGPNSAGKSAVYDALELLAKLWSPEDFEEIELQKLLRRWAHKVAPSGDGNVALQSPRLAVEFEFSPKDPWDEAKWDFAFGGYDDIHLLKTLPRRVARLDASFVHCSKRDAFDLDWVLLSVAGIPWVELGRSLTVVSPGNQHVQNILDRSEDLLNRYGRLLAVVESSELGGVLGLNAPEEDLHHDGGLDDISGWAVTNQARPVAYILTDISGLSPYGFRPLAASLQEELKQNVTKGARDLLTYFGGQLVDLLERSPPVVRADRRIPTPKEAQTFLHPNLGYRPRDTTIDPNDPVAHLNASGEGMDPHWQYLAQAAFSSVVSQVADETSWETLKDSAARLAEYAAAFNRINGYLRDELFRERLYQVCCKAAVLFPVLNEDYLDKDEYLLTEPALVRLLLRDGEYREIDLHDVGSGLSFVLPVLCAVARDGVVQLQQPELHLHPALQGDLADVFVTRLNEKSAWQAVVETHSEHLVLRLLRRIRDTTKGKVPAQPLTTADVAIYYFDPQVTGGTRVARQAISPAGDFYVDWPGRGFFRDRESDLFDE